MKDELKTLLINNLVPAIGDLTVERTLEDNKLIIEGVLSMHDYIEEISSIESDRYILTGVKVFREGFGSNDIRIIYSFYAKKLEIKNGQRLVDDSELLKLEKERWEVINGSRD